MFEGRLVGSMKAIKVGLSSQCFPFSLKRLRLWTQQLLIV